MPVHIYHGENALEGAAGGVSSRSRSLITARNLTMGAASTPVYDGTALLYDLDTHTGLSIEVLTSYDGTVGSKHTVDWGDGVVEEFGGGAYRTHTYAHYGRYVVQIVGGLRRVRPVRNPSSPPPSAEEGTVGYASYYGLKRIYNYTGIDLEIGVGAQRLASIDNATSTTIPARSISYAYDLQTVNAPYVTSVGQYALRNCSSLRDVAFGTVESFGSGWLTATSSASSSLSVTVGNTMNGLMSLANWHGSCDVNKTRFYCGDGYIAYENGAWTSHYNA